MSDDVLIDMLSLNEVAVPCESKLSHLPDTITVSTCSSTSHSEEDEEDSCCSSLSSDLVGTTTAKPHPRSIFGEYWSSQGYSSAPFHRFVPLTALSPLYKFNDAANQIQPENVDCCTLPRTRRTIFGSHYGSLDTPRSKKVDSSGRLQEVPPEFKGLVLQPAMVRKIRSAPVLERRSALKGSRSLLGTNNPSSLPRSVSFNDHVRVTLVPPRGSILVEHHASEGWSDWFA